MRAHLPAFTRTEVESHNCEKSCYVAIGDAVYDVTEFLQSHPGGADLVLKSRTRRDEYPLRPLFTPSLRSRL